MLCIIFSLLNDGFLLRTGHSYNYQVSLLNGPMAKENSITYGITCNSPLNQIDNFHVTNSQLPQDVMHVLLEGMLPLETKLMINSFLASGFFTLDTLINAANTLLMEEQDQEINLQMNFWQHTSLRLHQSYISQVCTTGMPCRSVYHQYSL